MISAVHNGNGAVDVNILVKRNEELTDVIAEFVAVNNTIIQSLKDVTDDKALIQSAVQEMLGEYDKIIEVL